MLSLLVLATVAAPPLTERLKKWKAEIEQRGELVVVVRIGTDRETNQIRVPPATPRRFVVARYLADERFAEQFRRTHAMTINYQAEDGRAHLVLLNMDRAAEFKDAEEALIAHEFGHAWLDALGFRSPDYSGQARPCLAIHTGDIVQHILIRRELETRGFPYRDNWIRNLDLTLDALHEENPPAPGGECDSLARVALWIDVRLGLNPESWSRHGEFDAAFRRHFPELAATVDELVQVLNAVDVTVQERYRRALAYVGRRLVASFPSP